MLLTPFRLQYPEFSLAGDDYVQAYLDVAALRLDTAVWGTLFDQGHGLLAAHLMAATPAGLTAGMTARDGTSPYWKSYSVLCRQVAGGPRVV